MGHKDFHYREFPDCRQERTVVAFGLHGGLHRNDKGVEFSEACDATNIRGFTTRGVEGNRHRQVLQPRDGPSLFSRQLQACCDSKGG